MGQEIRAQKVSALVTAAAISFAVFAASTASAAESATSSAEAVALAKSAHHLEIATRVSESESELDTAMVWKLAPDEWNPHEALWIVEKAIEVRDLKAHALGSSKENKVYSVSIGSLVSTPKYWVRGPGTWYSQDSEFADKKKGCSKKPNSDFAQIEGSRVAGKKASELWNEYVTEHRGELALRLSKIRLPSEASALAQAKAVIQDQILNWSATFRAKTKKEIRAVEWAYYFERAVAQRRCKRDSSPGVTPVAASDPSIDASSESSSSAHAQTTKPEPTGIALPLRKRMEPLPEYGERVSDAEMPTLLARVPARRWDGLYSIRISVEVGSKKLDGQFLIDTGSDTSLIAPHFLERQGVKLDTLERQEAKHFSWTGGEGLARFVPASGVKVGPENVPLSKFLLVETELFGPPESLGTCCDGVLGLDFLRNFAVEFQPNPRPTVLVYKRDKFVKLDRKPVNVWPWFAIHLSTREEGVALESACFLENGADFSIGTSRIDSGSSRGIEAHGPWTAEVLSSFRKREEWRLRCEDQVLAEDFPLDTANPLLRSAHGPFFKKQPALTLGMDFLAREGFVLDLANGRIWLEPQSIPKAVASNQTGVTLKFILNPEDERELVVSDLETGKAADALKAAGVKVGTRISKLQGAPAKTYDGWEVRRILSGARGPEIEWAWVAASTSTNSAKAAPAKTAPDGASDSASVSAESPFEKTLKTPVK